VFSLLLRCLPAEEDELTAELLEEGTAGIQDEPGGLRAFFDEDSRLEQLTLRFARFTPEPRVEAATDWEQVSRDAWPPIDVGERWRLVPPWNNDLVPPGRLRLEIQPGMACGTGHHPATQLALEALERYLQPGACVVDVGTGSGILSKAALLLGASQVFACDIDAEAVEIARARVEAQFYVGSVDALQRGVADVVVANISSAVVETLRADLERVRRPGGVLILSGFQVDDLPQGLEPKQMLVKENWSCLIV
jgi:ribosomal protein L11 methyltransferase